MHRKTVEFLSYAENSFVLSVKKKMVKLHSKKYNTHIKIHPDDDILFEFIS